MLYFACQSCAHAGLDPDFSRQFLQEVEDAAAEAIRAAKHDASCVLPPFSSDDHGLLLADSAEDSTSSRCWLPVVHAACNWADLGPCPLPSDVFMAWSRVPSVSCRVCALSHAVAVFREVALPGLDNE